MTTTVASSLSPFKRKEKRLPVDALLAEVQNRLDMQKGLLCHKKMNTLLLMQMVVVIKQTPIHRKKVVVIMVKMNKQSAAQVRSSVPTTSGGPFPCPTLRTFKIA